MRDSDPEGAERLENELVEGEYLDAYSDYSWAIWTLQDLLEQENPKRTAKDLYRNTAGEIEARNVAGRRNLTAEERKNTPPNLGDEDTVFTEDTGISFDMALAEYPYNMQTVIQDYLDAVDQNVLSFVEDVQTGRAWSSKKITVGSANTRMSEEIARLTGVENSEGQPIVLNTSSVEHVMKRHGAKGEADHSMQNNLDFARINYVLQNFDYAELSQKKSYGYRNRDGSPAPNVLFSKKINGTYYVVEAVPDTGKLGIVSAYINKKGASQVLDDNAPSPDVRNVPAYTPNKSLAEDSDSVKQFSISAADNRGDTPMEKLEQYIDEGQGRSIFRSGWLEQSQKMVDRIVKNRPQTETKAFLTWFGNSQATNAEGEPLLVFHGTTSRFTSFDAKGKPIWVSANPMYARAYADRVSGLERLAPASNIYSRANERIIPAYIRAEMPADFGDTDHRFEIRVRDVADTLGIPVSELQGVWERTGRKDALWETVNTAEMVSLLRNYGYDSIKAVEGGSNTWAVFDGNQIKSAVANNGSFDDAKRDIRYSISGTGEETTEKTAEQTAEKKTAQQVREEMPAKARNFLEGTERKLLKGLGEKLRVSKFQNREALQDIVREISDEFLTEGYVSEEKLDFLFDKGYAEGIVEDARFYEENREIKRHLQTTGVTISKQDQADIADYNDFKKRARGTLRIVKDGLPEIVAVSLPF